jgi:hypothetical protein
MFHEVHELFARARGGQEGLEGQGEEGGQAGNGPALSLPTDLPFTIPSDPNDNNGPRTLGVIWLLLALAMALLSLRLWSKFQRQRGLWWDDYVIVASWACLFPKYY